MMFKKLFSWLKKLGEGGYSQVTSGAGLSTLIMSYYDRMLNEYLFPQLRFNQGGERRPLPRRSGTSITFNRFTKPTAVLTNLGEGSAPSQTVVSASKLTINLIQRGAYTQVSDMLVMTAIDPIVEDLTKWHSDHAAVTVDTYIRNRVGFLVADVLLRSSLTYASTLNSSAKTARVYSGTTDGEGFPLIHNKGRLATSAAVTGFAKSALTMAMVRDAVARLRREGVRPFDDGNYIAFVHPTPAAQLRGSGNLAAWAAYSKADKMYRGEIGTVEGVRFIETSNHFAYALSADQLSTLSATLFGTIFVGKGAYGITEIDDNSTEVVVKTPNKYDTSNPLNQWSTVGWKMTMAASILNKSAGVIVITTEKP